MYDTKVKQYTNPKFGPELVSQETTNSLFQMTLEDDENCQRLKQRIKQDTVYIDDQPKEMPEFSPYLPAILILVVALAAIKVFYMAIKSDSKQREEEE